MIFYHEGLACDMFLNLTSSVVAAAATLSTTFSHVAANVTATASLNITELLHVGAPALYKQLSAKAAALLPGTEEAFAAIATERLLYVNQAGSANLSAAALELDTVVLGLSLLTMMHAMLHHRLLLLPLFLLVGITVEQLAIRVAQTHCHSEALLMLSQCSSGSSVAVYVPALYACQLAAARLPLHAFARPFAMGVLLCVHSAPHLLLGSQQGWWVLSSSSTSSAAAALPAHSSVGAKDDHGLGSERNTSSAITLHGGALWTLGGGASTTLTMPPDVEAALAPRFFDIPTLLPLLTAGVGGGLGAGLAIRASLARWLTPPRRLWWCVRAPLALWAGGLALSAGTAAAAAAFYVPSGVLLPAMLARGVSQSLAIAALLLLLLVPVLLLPPPSSPSKRAAASAAAAKVADGVDALRPPLSMPRTDVLLFAIPLWQHAYLLVWPAWLSSGFEAGTIESDLYVVVVVASSLALAVHARAALLSALPHRAPSTALAGPSDHHRPRSSEHHSSHPSRSTRGYSASAASSGDTSSGRHRGRSDSSRATAREAGTRSSRSHSHSMSRAHDHIKGGHGEEAKNSADKKNE